MRSDCAIAKYQLQPTLYTQAKGYCMGITIGIVMGWWNALNGPFVARWADSGMLNRHVPWFASWGRRAPWLLLGTPLLMAGTVMMWLPPALDALRRTIDQDVGRLTASMSRLEVAPLYKPEYVYA